MQLETFCREISKRLNSTHKNLNIRVWQYKGMYSIKYRVCFQYDCSLFNLEIANRNLTTKNAVEVIGNKIKERIRCYDERNK